MMEPNDPVLRPDAPAPQTEPEPMVSEEAVPEQPDGEITNLDAVSEELDQHRRQVKELEDQLLRRVAEFQNYRRRTAAELGQAAERGRGEVVLKMLDVLDDLGRSLEAAEDAEAQSSGGPAYRALKEGVDLVHMKFEAALREFGAEPIEAMGEQFDEEVHEALMQQDVPNAPPGLIVGEIQKGYRMGDRILRHARVVVAR